MAAVVDALVIHHVAAVKAGDAIPVRQADVGTIRVVSVEDAPHHHEEIAQPAIFQGRPDSRGAIALAEHFIAHVGVGNGLIFGRRMRLDRDHIICDLVIYLLQLVHV